MKITHRYRLYPTKAQRTSLRNALDACRWVYNKTLEVRRDAWQERQESMTRFDTIGMLREWKQDFPRLKLAHSQTLQDACTRVDLAFKAFFRRVKRGDKPGYPRFRSKNRYDSFTYIQSGFNLIGSSKLYLSKIGNVKIKLHRPIQGKIKTLTIRRDSLGNWWACFSCKFEPEPQPPVPDIVGVDVGLEKFATLSTGEQIENPRFFRKDEKSLAKAQRKLSTCDKGTPERRKKKRVIQHIHQRIANRRKDFAHKLSRRLINEFQIIAFEDLDIPHMQSDNWRSMNKGISDAAWNQLVRLTQAKAEWAGRTVVKVDPRNTSQMCSGCGEIVKKDLSVRIHECPHCGLVLNRDLNAALNILARGLVRLGENP